MHNTHKLETNYLTLIIISFIVQYFIYLFFELFIIPLTPLLLKSLRILNNHNDTRCIAEYQAILVKRVLLIFLAFLMICKSDKTYLWYSHKHFLRDSNHSCVQNQISTKSKKQALSFQKKKLKINVTLKTKHKVLPLPRQNESPTTVYLPNKVLKAYS